MKNQTIGVEIEFMGIARENALAAFGKYLGNAPYGGYHVKDAQKRDWTIIRDGVSNRKKRTLTA